jgi:hypothetical protein
VNEAGQDLGDKLDNDEVVTFNKSMEVINEILQKARTQSKLERDAKKKGFKPATSGPRGTRVKPPRPFMQPKVEPPKVEPTTDEKDKKPIEEAIDKAAGTTNKKSRQKKGGTQWHQRAPGARSYDPSFTPSEADTTRISTSDEMARQRATTIGDPTQIKKPTTPQSDDPSANTPNPRRQKKAIDKAAGLLAVAGRAAAPVIGEAVGEKVADKINSRKNIGKANGDPEQPPRINPPVFTPPSGQNPPTSGTDTGASTKGPSVWDSMKRQFGSTAGAAASGLGQAVGATRDVVGRGAEAVGAGGRQVMERGREGLSTGAQRMGELFGAGKKRLGEAGQAVKRGAIRADLAAGEAGRRVKAGAQEVGRRAVEGGRRAGAAGQEAGRKIAEGGREFGSRVAVDARAAKRGAQAAGRRAALEGRRAGRGAQEGGRRARAGAKEASRRVGEGASEFGGGLREGFGSYDRDAHTFDEIRSGGGQRDQFGDLRRTAADGRKGQKAGERSGARRIGQLFGAGTRATGEAAGEGTRLAAQEAGRFGRGVARGARPGSAGESARNLDRYGPGAVIDEQGRIHGARGTKRSASEKFGQWLGERGRERTADAADITGQTARGFGRGVAPGEWGKRQRAEWDAKGGDRSFMETVGRGAGTAARGGGRWGANIPTKAGRETPRFGSRAQEQSHMMNNEGVGKGINFQPNAHRGASLSEKHQMATGLADRINSGEDMSPKEWMEVIHHMSQTPDGQRYANFSDIDIKHSDWNKPIAFSDMRQHLDRMNVSHGTHGATGQRGFDKLVNKLTNVASGADRGGLKFNAPKLEDGGRSPDANYEEEQQDDRRQEQRERRRNRRQRQTKPRDSSNYYEGSFPVMNSTDYQSKNSVTDTFKRAFNMPTSKGV